MYSHIYFLCLLQFLDKFQNLMLIDGHRLICNELKEENNNPPIFILKVFKLLARTYASAHERMSNENARCGSSRTHSQKGIINGAQWSSIAGSEFKTFVPQSKLWYLTLK